MNHKDAEVAESKRFRCAVGAGWLAEAERRYQEIKAGIAQTIPSEEVFAALAIRHQKRD